MGNALIALAAIFWMSVSAAWAESAPPTPAATNAMTPAEAAQAIEVLQDPAKRAALIGALQIISKAAAPTASATATPAPTPTPSPSPTSAVLTLQPDSLGAQLVVQASQFAAESSEELLIGGRAFANAPALARAVRELYESPGSRAELVEGSWRLLLTFVPAVLAELLLAFALKRPMAALAGPRSGSHAEPQPDETHGDLQNSAHDDRRLLHRLPLALLRFVLMLLPIGAFAAAGLIATMAQLGATEATRLVILEALKAYVLCRVVIALVRTLAASDNRRLRLLKLDDRSAAFLERWACALIIVTVVGATLSEIAGLLNDDFHVKRGIAKLAAIVLDVCLITMVLQARIPVARRLRAREGASGAIAAARNRLAEFWHVTAIATIVALWFVWATRMQGGWSRALQLVVVSAAALAVVRVLAIVAFGALDRAFHARSETTSAQGSPYYATLRAALSFVMFAIGGALLLEIWGANVMSWFAPGAVAGRLLSAVVEIGVAVGAAALVWEAVNAAMERRLDTLTRGASHQRAARLRTLLPILRTTLMISILTIVVLTVLSEIGVNIGPLLAGAGIVGIAVGFGSQKLVQDLITGLFLLLENAIQVGDWVTAAGLSGSVETLSIRTMRLRAADGSVHIVPFSSVTSVTNANRGLGNAAVSVRVAYEEDVDRVEEVLSQIAEEMREDAKFRGSMLSDLQLWGVDAVDGAASTIVGQIVCTDAGRWAVQREFNRRMKQKFQELGIRIAPPTSSVVVAPVINIEKSEEREEAPLRRPARSRSG